MTAITKTVREIALEQPTSIRVFEQFGIDYCCGGRKPLAEACAASQLGSTKFSRHSKPPQAPTRLLPS